MMKKIRIFIALIILSFSFSVKAEVLFELDCNSKDIIDNSSITCEGWLSYEEISINDIEFEYETNLNIDFNVPEEFSISQKDKKVLIHTDEALYDEIMNSTKIIDITISAGENNREIERLSLKNIFINNSNQKITEDINEEFNVSLENKEEVLDDNCYLDSISIDKVPLSNFDKEKLDYSNIIVNNEKVFIDAVRQSDKSSATGLGEVIVNKGESIVRDIVVTAQNGDKKIYKLHLTSSLPKEEIKSSNNNLKSITILNNNKLNFDYNKQNTNFNIQVDGNVEEINIKAELEDNKAMFVNKYNPRKVSLKYGTNNVLLIVKAEDGKEKSYTLNITRVDNRSKDAFLSNLVINNQEINLVNGVYKYEITVQNNVLKTEIKALSNSDKAKVKYEDIVLNAGNNNVVILVTAENGNEQKYEINIIRELEPIKKELILDKIMIVGYDLPFSKDKYDYYLKINKNTDELNIKIIPDGIDYEVLNNKKLHNGNVVTIKINDDNGEHQYKIKIEKDSLIQNIICYIVFGIGIISFIMSITYINKKRK